MSQRVEERVVERAGDDRRRDAGGGHLDRGVLPVAEMGGEEEDSAARAERLARDLGARELDARDGLGDGAAGGVEELGREPAEVREDRAGRARPPPPADFSGKARAMFARASSRLRRSRRR